MSHELVGGVLHFSCDGTGCRRNYECSAGEFRAGWAEAKVHGWIGVPEYVGNISKWRHYCTECKKEFGE